MDLYDGLPVSHSEVVHVRVKKRKASGWEGIHGFGVKGISHPDFEGSGDDRDVFPLRMPMGSDAESVRHLQANGEGTCRGGRVALEHGKLRA